MITIVSNFITPWILQSDNGAEVCSPFLRCLLFRFFVNFLLGFVLSIFPMFCNLIISFHNHLQFLGHCVELINKEFPHIHVVKGKARKLTTQGSIEVSHKAFKEALVTWCNNTGSNDWVYGSYIVQNEVNHRPMRTRGNISPHTLYYSATPNNSYSTVLGAAYSHATT